MKILIVGHKGQLGRILMATPTPHERVGIDLPEQDITHAAEAIPAILALAPDAVINPAAFTNVDAAEANPDLAYRVNAHGAGTIARACHSLGIPLIQISSNEVFDGTRAGQPYDEWDQAHALSTYARSKLAGENAARFYHDQVLIVRIAWLFAPGDANFPGKICAVADKQGALKVVDDEFGNPTYAPDLAPALFALLDRQAPPGIYHLTNAGACSRYEFACEVLRQSGRGHIPVTPIPHTAWPRPSQPPLRALLANRAAAALGIQLRPWQEAVAEWAAWEKGNGQIHGG
ncbi:MAG: dTDP-4-dehydrorhamnose reductase [Caldilineales bacterium]|nr:dTDP-4-dehydrorhamnose reductase [Caldilineales bacterium]